MRANRQVRPVETAAFLRRHPVFGLQEAADHLGLGERLRTALSRVKYQVRKGRVKAVCRGVYAAVPPGMDAARFRPDRYLVAAALRPDAVFSHHAALELLGAAHSEWKVCTVFSTRRGAPLRLGGTEIRFLLHPAPLRRLGRSRAGTRQVERLGRELLVTGPERTLLDGFRQPHLAGGLEELVESAAGFGVLDLDLTQDLLREYRQRSLWSAVGWFLETYQRAFSVPSGYLARLEQRRPDWPVYLPRRERSGGEFVKRWNLILPRTVLHLREPDEPQR